MVIYEEVGPRWDEGCRRGEKGEEPRRCGFQNEEVAGGQCQMERKTQLCSLLLLLGRSCHLLEYTFQ